jgi:hypothetical protein
MPPLNASTSAWVTGPGSIDIPGCVNFWNILTANSKSGGVRLTQPSARWRAAGRKRCC